MVRKFESHRIVLVILVGLSLLGMMHGKSYDTDSTKVLLLNSYHTGYLWSDDIVLGLETSMKGAGIDLHVEYMDTKRQYDSVYMVSLTELYNYKLRLNEYELVITSDDNAFNFALAHRDNLFKDLPIVFCGINYLDYRNILASHDIVGVNEVMDIELNLELINILHPDVERIMVITDNTTTGRRVQHSVDSLRSCRNDYSGKIELVCDVTVDELIAKVEGADEHTVILHAFFLRDSEGTFIEYDESISLIVKHADVPIYTGWDFSFGEGVVGGYMMRGFDQGFQAGEMVKEIVSGVSIDEMEKVIKPESKLLFDYRVLKELGINEADLPEGSEVLFKPQSIFRIYHSQLTLIFVIFVALLVFSLVLFEQLRKTRKVSKELKHTEDQINSMMSNILGVVYRCDVRDGEWIPNYINSDIKFFTGKDPSFFYGKSVEVYRDFIHKHDREVSRNENQKAILERRSWECLYRLIHNNGDERWVIDRGQGIWDATDTLVHIDGIIYDITDRKRAEDELVRSNRDLVKTTIELEMSNVELQEALEEAMKSRELQELNQKLETAYSRLQEAQAQLISSEKLATVGVLAAGIAHEINNPLNFIQVAMEALKANINISEIENGGIVEELIDSVEMGVERTSKIVKSLNMFSRKSDERKELCNLHKILDNCLVMLQHQTLSIEMKKRYDASTCVIEGNMGELHQVFLNILVNAVQAIEDVGRIDIHTRSKLDEIIVEIEDSGVGISEENMEKVIDPFFTTKEPGKGTGLGMSISLQIVQDHKGTIDISSEEGVGTKITIKFPIK